jgi:hypothetical protein
MIVRGVERNHAQVASSVRPMLLTGLCGAMRLWGSAVALGTSIPLGAAFSVSRTGPGIVGGAHLGDAKSSKFGNHGESVTKIGTLPEPDVKGCLSARWFGSLDLLPQMSYSPAMTWHRLARLEHYWPASSVWSLFVASCQRRHAL